MSDPTRLPDPLPAVLRLPRGVALIIRHPDPAERARLVGRLLPVCRTRGVLLLVAGDARLARNSGADGLHLSESLARRGEAVWRLWRRPDWLVTVAAHSPRALRAAARLGVDAALLSPVFPTASHPGVPTVGVIRFARWARGAGLAVYALGGVDGRTVRRLLGSGAVGIAGIGALAD